MKIHLGNTYQDKVTGFTGVATGHVDYISGCNQTLLVPKVGADNKPGDPSWVDDQRLVSVDAPTIVLDNSKTPGCDAPAPKR